MFNKLLVTLIFLLSCICASASTTILNFEDNAELALWHYENAAPGTPVDIITLSTQWATNGNQSLCFTVPRWQAGQSEWPAFMCTPTVTDWSEYDRYAWDVTNPTGFLQKLFLFTSDENHATRDGYQQDVILQPYSLERVVVPIKKLTDKGLNPAKINNLHFFTERPAGDMTLFIDNFTLLKAGEELPVLTEKYLQAFPILLSSGLEDFWGEYNNRVQTLRTSAIDAPETKAWLAPKLAGIQRRVEKMQQDAGRIDPSILTSGSRRTQLLADLKQLETTTIVKVQYEAIQSAVLSPRAPRRDIMACFATSMEKILPRANTIPLTISKSARIKLAQNEKEAIQVIVTPTARPAKNVQVRVNGDLKGPQGAVFSAENIATAVMGYTETIRVPPYGSSHVGWWPDPILTFQNSCDIARNDAQSFWVRAYASQDQKPGIYRGKLEVVVDDVTTLSFDFSIQVYGFAMPKASPLPLAITWWPMYYGEVGGEGELLDTTWRKHKNEWADMLADNYMSWDSLYAFKSWSPDFDILSRMHKAGRLGRFNLGYYSVCGESAEDIAAWRKATIDVIRPRYEQAKTLGILDHAYIYGCDENPEAMFPGVERAAKILKQEFPDALILTTTYDQSFGLDSVLKSMDAFCPLTPSYNKERADKVRADGKEVWWYICCGPGHPFANMFIEYPAIEGRLLMGAMTAKYRPDGFLFYQTSIWNSGPIEKGPYTDWNPRSWTTYHGDGSWTCLGPDSTPLPTIRLENFRDGLEDYAYYRILEATVAQVEANPDFAKRKASWLKDAKKLLDVPENVTTSMTEFTNNPTNVYDWRNKIAVAIEAAGIAPVYPFTDGGRE